MKRLKVNFISIVLTVVFLFPIIKGFLFKFSSDNLKSDINSLASNTSFIVAIISGVYYSKKIFIEHSTEPYLAIFNSIPDFLTTLISNNKNYVYILIIPIVTFILYHVIYGGLFRLFKISVFPISDGIENFMQNKPRLIRRICGALFEVPKATFYILIFVVILNLYTSFNESSIFSTTIIESKTYNLISEKLIIPMFKSDLVKKLPNILDNSFKIEVVQSDDNSGSSKIQKITYYNGVTLKEGIKSDVEIDSFAVNLAKTQNSTLNKSQELYKWISKNISYDESKAEKILNDNFSNASGAIPAFETKKGICFDFACLYTAMCRANGIKVRLITGEGYSGKSWVSHAWNQVYIPEEKKWINVDTTFSKGGEYFNNSNFNKDHRNSKIAGEW